MKSSKNTDYPDCIAAGQQNKIWGEAYMLKGQIASVQLLNESLSQSVISEIYLSGEGFMTKFGAFTNQLKHVRI